jgi:hypothetical protein
MRWLRLTETEKAIEFVNSDRGRYIVSQALSIAIRQMKQVKPPHREPSNISDMEYLHKNLFPIYQPEIMEMTPAKFKRLMRVMKNRGKH